MIRVESKDIARYPEHTRLKTEPKYNLVFGLKRMFSKHTRSAVTLQVSTKLQQNARGWRAFYARRVSFTVKSLLYPTPPATTKRPSWTSSMSKRRTIYSMLSVLSTLNGINMLQLTYLRKKLVHLHDGNVLPQANPRSHSKDKALSIHLLR